MNKEDIVFKVNEIFKDAFDDENLCVTDETVASDIAGWDSLMQMNLIEMVEDEFEIRFDMDEIISLKNVGDMINVIISKV